MLEVRDLDAFYGGAHILHALSLSLGEAEVLALLGRNGAGKSTTMKAIMGLVPPRAGRITFDGHDITGLPPHEVCRRGLGYVPEDRRVFRGLTVDENLEVGRRPARPDAPHWTPERLFRLFPNLAERRGQPAARLSGGEQQMLTIARTLMGNPRCVLLDEPSEGIAPAIAEQLAGVIVEMKREGLSVLLSEQNLHFARAVADRTCIIEKGHLRWQGSFAELDANPEIGRETLAL